MSPPPMYLPEFPEFWAALGEWLVDGRPLTDQERAECLAICEAPVSPVQGSLLP